MSYQIIVRTPVEDGAIITAHLDDVIATLMPDDEEVIHESEREARAYHEHRVRWYACRNNGGGNKLDDETAWVHERVNAGESLTDIGHELGVTPQALGRRLRRYRERLDLEGRVPYPGNRFEAKRPGAYRKDALVDRGEVLLGILRELGGWRLAGEVARHPRAQEFSIQINGVGRALTKLGREGKVEVRREGGWNSYRAPGGEVPDAVDR